MTNIFLKHPVLSIEDLKNVLQTNSRMTVFRKLKQLPYKSSYSHCGRYYTLDSIAKYNDMGIWTYNQIYFSQYGTLKSTVLKHIEKSIYGLASFELEEFLHVPVYNTVLNLYKMHMIDRKQIGKEYVYLSLKNGDTQFHSRKQKIQSKHKQMIEQNNAGEYLTLFMSLLNEKQQRLFAGYESLKIGYGGDKQVAVKTGLNVKTVSRGRKELMGRDIDVTRIREIGAGRPSLKKTKKF
ncbi:hypothetical protein DRP43_05995 [candidate division TA06 bacterium]|uniref:Uncharacterized protein n=1 Tax=candidate division TA06 bacterium TaxID=2250710 RepID=A0A660SC76_UNCT6|nr:MAG: hypothetical protein DRP43_05995 [candidate division TA06 bacterium]